MNKITESIFKPKLTSGEVKGDATTRVARQIIDGEKAAREAKSERLRLARLAKQEAEPIVTTPKPKVRSAKHAART